MKKRSLPAVFILPFVTFGVYGIVWAVKTKNEMNSLGAEIPTAWLLIVPIANIYWYYKYAEGVERITGAKISTVTAFLLELFLGVIGNTILQSEFNKLAIISQPIVAEAVTPMPESTITAPQMASAMPTTPVEPVIPPAATSTYQYQQPTVPTPEAVVNSQSISPTPSDDNSQTPLTPNQF